MTPAANSFCRLFGGAVETSNACSFRPPGMAGSTRVPGLVIQIPASAAEPAAIQTTHMQQFFIVRGE
jgi:hypothetical protein